MIERMYGLEYTRPAAHTREYVEVLRRAFAASATSGEPGAEFVAYEGEFFDVNAMLVVPGADAPVPILVAALAPLMLRLAGELADGTITYWANERALRSVVPRLTAAAAGAGRPAPGRGRGAGRAGSDPDAAREAPTHVFGAYEAIPTYQRILGRSGDAAPADVAVIGTEADVLARLAAFADAGATDCARRRWASTTTAARPPAGPFSCWPRWPAGGDRSSADRLRLQLLELGVADDTPALQVGEARELVGGRGAAARDRLHVGVELLLRLLLLPHRTLGHAAAAAMRYTNTPR